MISMDDYEDEKGHIDWKAYEKARVNAGEKCRTCGAYLMSIMRDIGAYAQDCGSCERLKSSTEEREHDSLIRCPKCRETWNPFEDAEDYHLAENRDEAQDVTCQYCDHDFEVSTRIEYHFTSPALLPDEDEEEEKDGTDA